MCCGVVVGVVGMVSGRVSWTLPDHDPLGRSWTLLDALGHPWTSLDVLDVKKEKKMQKKKETTWTDAKKNEATLTGLEPATLGRITRSALKIERELISSQSP